MIVNLYKNISLTDDKSIFSSERNYLREIAKLIEKHKND